MDNSSSPPASPSVAADLREAEKKFNEFEEEHRREKQELLIEIQLKDETINQLNQELAGLKSLLLHSGRKASGVGGLSKRRRCPHYCDKDFSASYLKFHMERYCTKFDAPLR